MEFLLGLNWLAVGQIILIDILLGGDNAIVIALACRNLPSRSRMQGIIWGTVGAIIVRILLISFAVTLLQLPYIKLVGAVLLFWIGVKLLSDDNKRVKVSPGDHLLSVIKTIIVADLVMSMDNVIAVAGTAEQAGQHQLLLAIFGVLVSMPIIVSGSTLVLKLMQRFPVIITLGAALLGYLAGSMFFTDSVLQDLIARYCSWHTSFFRGIPMHVSIPGIISAFCVVVVGKWQSRQSRAL